MVSRGPTPEEQARVAAARDLGRQQDAYNLGRASGMQLNRRPALGGPVPANLPSGPVGDVRATPSPAESFGAAVISGSRNAAANAGAAAGGDGPRLSPSVDQLLGRLRAGQGGGQGGGERRVAEAQAAAPGANAGGGLNDIRVRLRPLNSGDFYGPQDGIMALLKSQTNGLLFPYTPTIQWSQTVDYAQLGLVHSIGDIIAYQRTPSVEITVSGKFTVQNQSEGKFALGCLHFCRVASKMRFGMNDPQAGLPPPILLLSGYGTYMFNDLRCVMKSHTWSFDETMDTVTVKVPGGIVRLPAIFTLSVSVQIQNTPAQMRTQFNMDAFKSGELLRGGGWI